MKNSNLNQEELYGEEVAMSVEEAQRKLMHQGGAKRKARKMTATLDMEEEPKRRSKRRSSKKGSKKASSKKRRSKKGSKKASSKKRRGSKQRGGAEEELVGGKRRSKKGSKKTSSKRRSRKGSKQSRVSEMVVMNGGKRKSKSGSKKHSSKRHSSKRRSSQKRTLHPSLAENIRVNKVISDKVGYSISPALITYVARKFGDSAKASVKDPKDFKAINKKKLELFEDYLAKNSKSKIVSEIEKVGNDLKAARKRNSKK